MIDMMQAIAVTDIHGNIRVYELLLRVASTWKATSLFISGDLAPSATLESTPEESSDGVALQRSFFQHDFIPLFDSFLVDHRHTDIYVIMGNDDRRANEDVLLAFDRRMPNFHLINDRLVELRETRQMKRFFPDDVSMLYVCGYPYVPPGAGLLMDWVKYDNGLQLRPAGMDPCADVFESGFHSVAPAESGTRTTIADDLTRFDAFMQHAATSSADRTRAISYDPARTIHLFHSPPYGTQLDLAGPLGSVDRLRRNEHVGSSEIRRFIERTQPYLVLCGHCHESAVIGSYKDQLGGTICVNPGSQTHLNVLSLVQFDVEDPSKMTQLYVNAD